jgi:hypothetical protein
MGWRGAIRSIGAALRAAEREAVRQQKANLKAQVAANSAAAVDAWKEHLDNLVSVHTSLVDPIDWRSMAAQPAPAVPALTDAHQREARDALARFRPGLFDWIRGGSGKIRGRLEQKLLKAPDVDRREYERAKHAHATATAEWEADAGLARRLLAGEVAAIKTVLEEMQSAIQGGGNIGTQINYRIEPNHVHATPLVHGLDIIPNFRRKQLASGRLSQTKMPAGELYELYQDYVGSVALKVAGDLFHILPLDEVYVTCEAEMVNPQTGHKESTPILSVHFVRSTFTRLNLVSLDPSDAMANFRYRMAFKRTQGFSRIEPLSRAAKAT